MHNPGLKLVPKRPTLEEQIEHYVREEISNFTWYVALARAVARDFPELIKAKNPPKRLKEFCAEYHNDPEYLDSLEVEDPFGPAVRERARKFILEARRKHA